MRDNLPISEVEKMNCANDPVTVLPESELLSATIKCGGTVTCVVSKKEDELFEDYYRQQKTNFFEVTKNAETLAGFLSTLTPDRHPESWLKWLRQSAEKSETI